MGNHMADKQDENMMRDQGDCVGVKVQTCPASATLAMNLIQSLAPIMVF